MGTVSKTLEWFPEMLGRIPNVFEIVFQMLGKVSKVLDRDFKTWKIFINALEMESKTLEKVFQMFKNQFKARKPVARRS